MAILNGKALILILGAVLAIAGAAATWQADRLANIRARQQFETAKQHYAQAEGYGAGEVAKTIRKEPR